MSPTELGGGAASEGVELAKLIGWKDELGDWEDLLPCSRLFGIRTSEGALVATGLIAHFGAVAAISKMLVHPDWRRRGLATRILKACLATLPPGCVAWLVATKQGQPLYEPFGFREQGAIAELWGTCASGAELTLPPVSSSELAPALALDAAVLGCHRAPMLEARWRRAYSTAVIRREPRADFGNLDGFAMAVRRGDFLAVGPVIARSADLALGLIRGVSRGWQGSLRIDVPTSQVELLRALRDEGFAPGETRPEMTLGGRPLPGTLASRYALCAAASL